MVVGGASLTCQWHVRKLIVYTPEVKMCTSLAGEASRRGFSMIVLGKSGLKSALRTSITMISKDSPTALMRPFIAWCDRRTLRTLQLHLRHTVCRP